MSMTLKKQTFITTFIVALALVLVSLPVAGRSQPKRVHIVVLGTTDQHGNLFPVDYYTDKADNRGLAKIATLIRQVRKENKNVLQIGRASCRERV